MTSLVGNQNSSTQESKIPTPKSNENARAVKAESSVSSVQKPPFETRKSGEELKLRLASAVSAKIAGGKDSRTPSNNNRGIGYLLQRKEQKENKLNTKDISFQKPVQNGNGRVEIEAKNSNSSGKSPRNGLSKAELQKSLLSALMNSRAPSGATAGQNKNIRPAFGNSASTVKGKAQSKNEPNAKPSTTTLHMTGIGAKSDSGARGKVDKERVKNLETLLGRRKQVNPSVTPTIDNKDSLVHGKDRDSESKDETSISNAKKDSNFKLNKTSTTTKPIERTGKDGIGDVNGKNNRTFTSNKLDGRRQLFQTTSKSGSASLNADIISNENKTLATIRKAENAQEDGTVSIGSKNLSQNKTSSINKPFEKTGKKLPPPVAKKPTKNLLQKSKQGHSALGVVKKESQPLASLSSVAKESSENPKQVDSKSSSPQIPRKGNDLRTSGAISGKEKEDLLEKLEADVGSCKIAAFQSMEDFSVLRMKVYRIRSELDQLKRDREKRASLVC